MPKLQIRLIEKAFDVGWHNRIKPLSSSTHLLNKCRQAAAYIELCTPSKNAHGIEGLAPLTTIIKL